MITGDRSLAQGKKGPFYYMLEEFSKHWERIDIICPKIRNPKHEIRNIFDNVFIHSSNVPLILHPWFILKKGQEIYKEQKFDLFIIHSYPPFYNDIGGLLLYKKIKTPYILEIMHIAGYPKAGSFKERFYKILTKLFIRFFAKNAKAVRIINQKQTGDFLKKSGTSENKLKYIPAFYVDFGVFKPQNLEKKYDLVFSGRLVRSKGIFLLLEAIKKIKKSQPKAGPPRAENIKLIIIGSGPLENKIKKYIVKNNLENNIELAGWLPTIEDLAKIYNQSKLMVMPSFNEGGPRVTLEAMACKVPVITTRVGVMIDIIKDRENGLFIDWDAKDIAQKITELLKDNNLREKIAENGYQTVQQFERKKIIKNYAEAYKNLLYST
jgi:glycosyltransferase involved in cell wall biosynthesis